MGKPKISILIKVPIIFMLVITFDLMVQCKNKTDELKTEVMEMTKEVNSIAVRTREACVEGAKLLEKAYENQDQYDLDISKMDEKDGGMYKWFENSHYYPMSREKFRGKGMAAFLNGMYLDPEVEFIPENYNKGRRISIDGPEMKLIKKEMRLYEHQFDALHEVNRNIGYKYHIFNFNPRGWLCFYSYYVDWASLIPDGVTFKELRYTPWCYPSIPEGNPERKPIWTKDAFIGTVGEGWLHQINYIIYPNNKYKGGYGIALSLRDIHEKLFKNNDNLLLFLGKSTSVLAISTPAKEKLGIKMIAEHYYLESSAKTPDFKNTGKLTHKSKTPDFQSLGNKILAGEKEFVHIINGKNYSVIVGDVKEIDFYIVGLVEK